MPSGLRKLAIGFSRIYSSSRLIQFVQNGERVWGDSARGRERDRSPYAAVRPRRGRALEKSTQRDDMTMERTPAATDDGNGLRWNASPFVLEVERLARGRSLSGEPNRPTKHSHQAHQTGFHAIFLRLSPTHGLTYARILSSQAPRTRPAPNSALPTPPPRARRTYSLSCSRTAHNSRPRAAPARTHMRQDPARTAQAPTHPLSHRRTWFGTWQSHVPEDSPSRLFASLKRETVTVSCSTPVTRPGGETSPTKLDYVDTPR